MILDLEAGEALLLRVPYDIEACRADLMNHGLPTEACHRRPVSTSLPHRIGRRAKRLLLRRAREAGANTQPR